MAMLCVIFNCLHSASLKKRKKEACQIIYKKPKEKKTEP